MENIGTYGLKAYIKGTNSLPIGWMLTQFADDVPAIAVQEAASGQAVIDLNGKIFRWSEAVPIMLSIGLVPDSTDDQTTSLIYQANRAISTPNGDSITLIVYYPTGAIRTFTNGRMVSGPSAPSAQPDGRLSSQVYTFAFEDQYTLSVASVLSAGLKAIGGRAISFLGSAS
jgi:hypothetical protein